jgi:hypothetical protein
MQGEIPERAGIPCSGISRSGNLAKNAKEFPMRFDVRDMLRLVLGEHNRAPLRQFFTPTQPNQAINNQPVLNLVIKGK